MISNLVVKHIKITHFSSLLKLSRPWNTKKFTFYSNYFMCLSVDQHQACCSAFGLWIIKADLWGLALGD